jgi:rubrerythrin
VEEEHAMLYKRALQHLVADRVPTYYVCQVCGYIAEGEPPDQCPVCGVSREQFKRVP